MKRTALLISLGLLSACSVDQGTFTVLSNKIVNVDQFELNKEDRIKDVKGEDQSEIIVFVPTKVNPNLSGALTDAFKKADGDVMTDVTVKSYSWYIPYIYGQSGWSVEGDVVKTRKK